MHLKNYCLQAKTQINVYIFHLKNQHVELRISNYDIISKKKEQAGQSEVKKVDLILKIFE